MGGTLGMLLSSSLLLQLELLGIPRVSTIPGRANQEGQCRPGRGSEHGGMLS